MKLVFKTDAATIAAMTKAYERLRQLHKENEAAQRAAARRIINRR
jgi:hypothetical protein